MPKKVKKEEKLPPIPERGDLIEVQPYWMEDFHYIQGLVLQTIVVSKIREYTPEAIDDYLSSCGLLSVEEVEFDEKYDIAVCIDCPIMGGQIWVWGDAVGDTFEYEFFDGAASYVKDLKPLPFPEFKSEAEEQDKNKPLDIWEILEKVSPTGDRKVNPVLLKLAREKLCKLSVGLEFNYVQVEDLKDNGILTNNQYTKLMELVGENYPELVKNNSIKEFITGGLEELLSNTFCIPIDDTDSVDLEVFMTKRELKELVSTILDKTIIEQ